MGGDAHIAFAKEIFRHEAIPHRKRDSAALRFGSEPITITVKAGKRLLTPNELVHDVVQLLPIEKLIQTLPSIAQKDQESSILDRAVCSRLLLDWAQLADTNNWKEWTGELFGNEGWKRNDGFMGRCWRLLWWCDQVKIPGRCPELYFGLGNFYVVFWHFYLVLVHYEGLCRAQRLFHTHDEQTTSKYVLWLSDFLHDLLLELTRAGNLICSLSREFYSGHPVGNVKLLVQQRLAKPGDQPLFVQYARGELRGKDIPYGGFLEFMKERGSRDFSYGNGVFPNESFHPFQQLIKDVLGARAVSPA